METAEIKSNFVRSDFSLKTLKVLRYLLPVFGFALLTALSTLLRIPLPGTPVPITLQSAVVLASGLILGARRGALSQALYVSLGALGLPFFASAAGIFGPTGGYLLGFVFAAALCGWLVKKTDDKKFTGWMRGVVVYATTLIASLALFGPGVLWLKVYTGQSWGNALSMGFVPFIFGDLLKSALAVLAWRGTQRS